ncbi:MAG: NfeD family protein [Phycisphaerales bacterium]|nr:NfeD family protein [Phycisphaerales bacterium]
MDSLLLIGVGLLGLGALLMVLEAFVPSGGILGIAAIASAIAGIVFLFRYDAMWGAIGLLGTAVLGPMIFFGALNMLPNTSFGKTMVGDSGEEIAQTRANQMRASKEARAQLVGLEGTALTNMRPSGVVQINGDRHDAIAQGGIVDLGESIRVTGVDGLTIEVRKI